MIERKQDQAVQQQQKAKQVRAVGAPAVFTPPSQDEEAFLKGMADASEGYDPDVTVGGPRTFTA